MDKRNVLAVGAHPDDVELGCGGTISEHLKKGDNVYVLVMTHGEKGNHHFDMKECQESLDVLGIPRENVIISNDFKDGYLADDHRTVSYIEEYIKRLQITTAFTHYYDDRHQDHRNCSFAVSSAARKIPEIFLYEGPSTNIPFNAHYIVGLAKESLDKKLEAIRCYKSQIIKGIVRPEIIESLARVNGQKCNYDFAEAFAINHIFRKNG